ncbi:hypothetical protein CDAR_497321 [Caerostris darwini]|uniref:Uncharacterized protein n=1 Tax=Caerostris darwini TaxID=1538125 RepID=A0AAV4S313_9ARAC|nr:hypothetical protein CDAR_497321 [Caerostris darwini]
MVFKYSGHAIYSLCTGASSNVSEMIITFLIMIRFDNGFCRVLGRTVNVVICPASESGFQGAATKGFFQQYRRNQLPTPWKSMPESMHKLQFLCSLGRGKAIEQVVNEFLSLPKEFRPPPPSSNVHPPPPGAKNKRGP